METTSTKNRKVNIQEETEVILKTVLLLDHSYGANYLVRILLGSKDYGFKEESHPTLETFGAFQDIPSGKIRDLIHYLVRKNYLYVSDKRFGIISITEEGENFLDHPEPIEVLPRYLYTGRHDRRLYKTLRGIRKELALQQSKPPFHIFTDYTLQCLVESKPKDIAALKEIPGIGDYKADTYGGPILIALQENEVRKEEDAKVRLLQMAQSPSHQEVKSLFESGMQIDEMAEKRQVKSSTIRASLFRLHKAGEIDLTPWIEDQVDEQELSKGAQYFQQYPNPRLKEAFEELGMDYETLRLCRLYVHKLSTVEEELRYAS